MIGQIERETLIALLRDAPPEQADRARTAIAVLKSRMFPEYPVGENVAEELLRVFTIKYSNLQRLGVTVLGLDEFRQGLVALQGTTLKHVYIKNPWYKVSVFLDGAAESVVACVVADICACKQAPE